MEPLRLSFIVLALSTSTCASMSAAASAANPTEIDITPTYYSDQNNDVAAQSRVHTFRIDFDVLQPLAKAFTLFYSHRNTDHGNSRFYVGSSPVYPGPTVDTKETIGLTYTGIRNVPLQISHQYRHRECCPATNDPTNLTPRSWNKYFLSAGYNFGPVTSIGRMLSYGITYGIGTHLTTPAELKQNAKAGLTDAGSRGYVYQQTFSVRVPLDRRGRTSAFLTYFNPAVDWYDTTAQPTYLSAFTWGVSNRINRFVTVNATVNQLQSHKQGYPVATPQAARSNEIVLSATFRFSSRIAAGERR
jgi:hypothetical protein